MRSYVNTYRYHCAVSVIAKLCAFAGVRSHVQRQTLLACTRALGIQILATAH
jgi:hypothetical protein